MIIRFTFERAGSNITLLTSRAPTSEALELPGSGLGAEVAEKCLFLCLSQTLSDRQKSKTGVNTGSAFPLWSKVRDEKGLKTHVEVATFLHNLPTLASGRFTLVLLACDSIRKRMAVRQTRCSGTPSKTVTLITRVVPFLTICRELCQPVGWNSEARVSATPTDREAEVSSTAPLSFAQT